MQPLNAIDAIAPAFTRTHETLFHPFRLGRSWKLAASQYLAFAGAVFFPFPLFVFFLPPQVLAHATQIRRPIYLAVIALTAILIAFFYLFARMELVAFEMIVTRGKYIAPMWRRYASVIWPWLTLKIVLGTLFSILLVAAFYLPFKHLVLQMAASIPTSPAASGTPPDPAAIQALMAPFITQMITVQFYFFSFFFLLKIPSTLLNDFVLPFFVLEDIPLLSAFTRGFNVFLADPVQVILYLVLKPILFLVGYIMTSIAVNVCLIPFFIVFAILFGFTMTLQHSSPHGATPALILAGIGAFTVLFAAMTYITFAIFGYLVAVLEAYGIYFLAGRYPRLAALLEPGPGGPFTPPPVFPSPEEHEDDDSGPPMPMDPAVA